MNFILAHLCLSKLTQCSLRDCSHPQEVEAAVYRSRSDHFTVTPSGGLFRSTSDPNISIYFPVRAVAQETQIVMQVGYLFAMSFSI